MIDHLDDPLTIDLKAELRAARGSARRLGDLWTELVDDIRRRLHGAWGHGRTVDQYLADLDHRLEYGRQLEALALALLSPGAFTDERLATLYGQHMMCCPDACDVRGLLEALAIERSKRVAPTQRVYDDHLELERIRKLRDADGWVGFTAEQWASAVAGERQSLLTIARATVHLDDSGGLAHRFGELLPVATPDDGIMVVSCKLCEAIG